MSDSDQINLFIADWAVKGGSELANTQSFVHGLTALLGVDPPRGSQTDDAHNDYVFERRVFQDNGDGSVSFGRLDAYKRGCFVLEAKQGSDADREAAMRGERDFFEKPAADRAKQGTAKRGTPGWASAMFKAKSQAERYPKALPIDHGWPPFLIVTDVGHCIDVYADFSGTESNTPSSLMPRASASCWAIHAMPMCAHGWRGYGPTPSASIRRRRRRASPD